MPAPSAELVVTAAHHRGRSPAPRIIIRLQSCSQLSSVQVPILFGVYSDYKTELTEWLLGRANGRVQLEQAIEAADLESTRFVDVVGIQVV